MADLIVLAGGVGIEKAAKDVGKKIQVPFSQGRGDASQDQTDIHSFGLLEPKADAFRNYADADHSEIAEEMLIDKAQLMNLTGPEIFLIWILNGKRSHQKKIFSKVKTEKQEKLSGQLLDLT